MSPATEPAAGARSGLELADILRLYGPAYVQAHRLPPGHRKVIRDLQVCRTAALGGHREHCPRCGFQRLAYNSCRNRHCPKCQAMAKAQWLEARRAELLPVPYFHLVFTLPHELNPVVLTHPRAMLKALFDAASQTLLTFGRNRFGGQVGFSLILHTWDQRLNAHFHVHGLIAGGALSFDLQRWMAAKANFLFPVRGLSKVFRGKFLAAIAPLNLDRSLLARLRHTPWVVYAKRPFAGPEQTLDYLGRYTHRVAIGNHRLVNLIGGKVSFTYRDRARGDVVRAMTLDAHEFIRRFLLHVLPKGFMRIRHYGFLANRCKGRALSRCRQLLGQRVQEPQQRSVEQWILLLTGTDITRCPRCGAAPLIRTELPPAGVWAHSRDPPLALAVAI